MNQIPLLKDAMRQMPHTTYVVVLAGQAYCFSGQTPVKNSQVERLALAANIRWATYEPESGVFLAASKILGVTPQYEKRELSATSDYESWYYEFSHDVTLVVISYGGSVSAGVHSPQGFHSFVGETAVEQAERKVRSLLPSADGETETVIAVIAAKPKPVKPEIKPTNTLF